MKRLVQIFRKGTWGYCKTCGCALREDENKQILPDLIETDKEDN